MMRRWGLINEETEEWAPKVFGSRAEAYEYGQKFGPEWRVEEL